MIPNLEFHNWEGKELIRNKGKTRGQRVKVVEVNKEKGTIIVVYLDTGRIVEDPHPYNFTLAELWRGKPYRPRLETIQRLRRLVKIDKFKIGKRYHVSFFGLVDSRIIKRLIAEGFLGTPGRLSSVLRLSLGMSWKEYQRERILKGMMWLEPNTVVYKILKDITTFSW